MWWARRRARKGERLRGIEGFRADPEKGPGPWTKMFKTPAAGVGARAFPMLPVRARGRPKRRRSRRRSKGRTLDDEELALVSRF